MASFIVHTAPPSVVVCEETKTFKDNIWQGSRWTLQAAELDGRMVSLKTYINLSCSFPAINMN